MILYILYNKIYSVHGKGIYYMEILTSILRITLIVFLFRAIVSIFAGIMVTKKMRNLHAENTAEAGDNINTIEVPEVDTVEMVKDDQCGTFVAKNNAYIVHIDNINYHFCSWECREKFLKKEVVQESSIGEIEV